MGAHTDRVQADTRSSYGGPDVLHVAETPTPRTDEVPVEVPAATVNRTDCGLLRGRPALIRLTPGLRRPRSPIPGTDFAGEAAIPTGRRDTITQLGRPLADGRFSPLIDRYPPMADVRSAYGYVLAGQKLGNVILDIP